jgi:hypothetical protein
MKLRAIEQNLHNVHDQEEVSKKLDEATVLLKILGKSSLGPAPSSATVDRANIIHR